MMNVFVVQDGFMYCKCKLTTLLLIYYLFWTPRSTKAVGITWMFIDKTGALQYFYMLDNVADASVELGE